MSHRIAPVRSSLTASGQEQELSSGAHDPENRQALWPSNYANTTTYNRIALLNQVRHGLISNGTTFEGKNFLDYQAKIIANSASDVAIRKGPLLAILTNRGSPSQPETFGVSKIGWNSRTTLLDLFTCRQYVVGADQSISISYADPGQGGQPYLFLTTADATSLGLCGLGKAALSTVGSSNSGSSSSNGNSGSEGGSGGSSDKSTSSAALSMISPHPAVVGAGVLMLVVAGAFGKRFA